MRRIGRNRPLSRPAGALTAGASVLLLLFILLGAEFLHNHAADFAEHRDCPSHQLLAVLSTALSVAIVLNFFLYPQQLFFAFPTSCVIPFFPLCRKPRAPPDLQP